jgi:hypothetical protein
MTAIVHTSKSYRDHAVTAREAANGVPGHVNKAYLRAFAENCDYLAASIENAATETAVRNCRMTGTLMSEMDTWHTAASLLKQFGDVAGLAVVLHGNALSNKNDHLGVAIWKGVGWAIAELERQKPDRGESMK